jgi:hypothetical protein
MPTACHNIMEELKTFISIHNIDFMLISETHFTEKSYLKLPSSTAYHPARTAQGGTAIIIKNCIKHYQLNSYIQDFIQATSFGGRLSLSLNHFSCLSSTKAHSKGRTI